MPQARSWFAWVDVANDGRELLKAVAGLNPVRSRLRMDNAIAAHRDIRSIDHCFIAQIFTPQPDFKSAIQGIKTHAGI